MSERGCYDYTVADLLEQLGDTRGWRYRYKNKTGLCRHLRIPIPEERKPARVGGRARPVPEAPRPAAPGYVGEAALEKLRESLQEETLAHLKEIADEYELQYPPRVSKDRLVDALVVERGQRLLERVRSRASAAERERMLRDLSLLTPNQLLKRIRASDLSYREDGDLRRLLAEFLVRVSQARGGDVGPGR